jgi:hypothetical protein
MSPNARPNLGEIGRLPVVKLPMATLPTYWRTPGDALGQCGGIQELGHVGRMRDQHESGAGNGMGQSLHLIGRPDLIDFGRIAGNMGTAVAVCDWHNA